MAPGSRIPSLHQQGVTKTVREFALPDCLVKQKTAPKNILGPAIKKIRVSRKWTLEQVAEKLRGVGMACSAEMLGRIEAQKTGIKDFEFLYLCAALGVTQNELWQRRKKRKVRLAG